MTVRYSLNWMGVVSLQWYKDRGLTERVSRTLTEDSTLTGKKAGHVIEYDKVIQEYCVGRIDCRGDGLGPYGEEIGVDVMKAEDWYRFGKWLKTFETDYVWPMDQLVELYERVNPKIEWWVENERK